MKIFLVVSFIFLSVSLLADDKFLQVSGECKVDVIPDRLSVSYQILVNHKEAQKSLDEAAKKNNSIIEKLKNKFKEIEISTLSYSHGPRYEWENNKRVYKDITTQYRIQVTLLNTKIVGEVLTMLGSEKLENLEGPNSFVSKELSKETYEKCLSIASADARSKADYLAKLNGVKITKPIKILETETTMQMPVRMEMNMMKSFGASADAAPVEPNIEIGKQEFNSKITIYYGIE